MTDQELLTFEREHHGDPYMTLARAKEMQQVGLQFWAVREGPGRGADRPHFAFTHEIGQRPSVSSMSVAGSRRCL
jgi:hypothetical protein